MNNKNLFIYNGIAQAAARVFNSVICDAGEYTAKDIEKDLYKKFFFPCDFNMKELITVSFDGSKCSFPANRAFLICAEFEKNLNIPAARRVKFVRAAESRPVAVAFDVPAAAKDQIKIIPAKRDSLHPVFNFVCINTRRRCLVTVNGQILTVVSVPNMYVSDDAKETYLIDPDLLKTGKGRIFVDDKNAINGKQTRPNAEYNFPAWETILPGVLDAQCINLTRDTFRQLQKAVTAAAKFSDNNDNLVKISGRADSANITVSLNNVYETDGNETRRESFVTLPQPCPFDFSVQINGKILAAAPAADSMYIFKNYYYKTGVLFAAAGAVSYLINLDADSGINTAAVPSVAKDAQTLNILDVCTFPESGTPNTPAAAALIETPAADSAPAAAALIETPAAVSFESDKTPAAADPLPVDETPATADSLQDAQETPAVPDSITAPAPVSNSLPVPCFVENLHAVYLDGVLSRVFYSQLLADDYFFNLFISGRDVYFLTFPANKTAPRLLSDVITPAEISAAADSLPVDETPATADSLQDAQETAANVEIILNAKFYNYLSIISAAVPQDAPAAPAVPQDAPALTVDETPATADSLQDAQETAATADSLPAVLIAYNFARRFRRAFQTAAAVLFLIICIAAPDSITAPAPTDSVPTVSVPVPEDAQETPAAADPLPVDETPATADSLPAVPVPALRIHRAPDAPAVPQDETPAVPDSITAAPTDSVPTDSVLFAAVPDSITAAPTDSVPTDSVPTVSVPVPEDAQETAAAADPLPVDETPATADSRQDAQETAAAPAVPQDETPAVPIINSPAPAPAAAPVPAVSGCHTVPAVPFAYVINCKIIH